MDISKLNNEIQGKAFTDAKQAGNGKLPIQNEPLDRHNAKDLDSGKDYVKVTRI